MASEAAKAAARARAKAQASGKKVKPKLPLGEFPKRISKEAKALRKDPVTLTGNTYNKQVSPSRAAAAAGNQRAFAKGTSTSYSPTEMTNAARRKSSRAGEEKARQYKDLPARRTKTGPASTSYSPQKMTKFDERISAARGKAKAEKTKTRGPKAGTAAVSKVVKRAKTTAREARDIPTAFGGIKDVLTNKGNTRPKGGKVNQLKSSIKNVASQVKETGKAAATGKKGRPAQKYQTSRGDTPATFWTQPKRK